MRLLLLLLLLSGISEAADEGLHYLYYEVGT
jgi:hypothetical protein